MANGLEETIAAAGFAKALVTLRPEAAAASAGTLANELGIYFDPIDEFQGRDLAVAAKRTSPRRAKSLRPDQPPRIRVFPRLGLAIGLVRLEQAEALRRDPRVEKVQLAPELSLIRPVSSLAAKALPGPTWGIERLRVPSAWKAGYNGKGVIVGHLDTGIDASHPALKGALHEFAEFDLTGELVPGARAHDSGDHGTHTAGTIAGRSTGSGMIGVAPGCKLASALVIEGGDVISRILGGLEWIVGQGSKVLSMSLGLRGYTPAFQSVIDALWANDVLPVIAVGNEFANSSRSPGNYVNVLSVGAMDKDSRVADFSSSQKFDRSSEPLVPDLVAPGVGVLSCIPYGQYKENDGSSMATPHIGGLAAILRQAAPMASAGDIETAILQSCRRPASMPPERSNRGVPDAVLALAHLGITVQPVARPAVSRNSRKPQKTARKVAVASKSKRKAGSKSKKKTN